MIQHTAEEFIQYLQGLYIVERTAFRNYLDIYGYDIQYLRKYNPTKPETTDTEDVTGPSDFYKEKSVHVEYTSSEDVSFLLFEVKSVFKEEPLSTDLQKGAVVEKHAANCVVDLEEFRSTLPSGVYNDKYHFPQVGDLIIAPPYSLLDENLSEIDTMSDVKLYRSVFRVTRPVWRVSDVTYSPMGTKFLPPFTIMLNLHLTFIEKYLELYLFKKDIL